MNRQTFRKALIIFSFLLLPITINYISPALVVVGAAKGVLAASFFAVITYFIISLFFGRVWCAWLCPIGGLQEIHLNVKDKKVNNKYNFTKYLIWLPWLTAIITLFILNGIKDLNFFFMTETGISISDPQNWIVFYILISVVSIMAFTLGKRGFCHHACMVAPMMIFGKKIRNIFRWPSLKLKSNKDFCIACKLCNKKCPMSIDVYSMVQKNNFENPECIFCGMCVDNCPKKAIKFKFQR